MKGVFTALLLIVSVASLAQSETKTATLITSQGNGVDWTLLISDSLASSDNKYISSGPLGAVAGAAGRSARLRLGGFHFTIPDEATISGVKVSIERSRTPVGAARIADEVIVLIKGTNPFDTSDNLAGINPWGNADSLVEYGGENPISLWGSTFIPTPAEVRANIFGVVIKAQKGTMGTNPTARIDFVSITVYYSDPIVVPVKLERLDAAREGNSVKLTWNVSEEANISAYIIERSTDGYNFQPIGSVNGENKKIYSFVDVTPSENNFYRLRMTDIDGKVKLSHIVSVKSKMNFQIKLSPNPVRGKLTVQHPKAEQKSRLHLLNNEGKLLLDMAIPENAVITTLDLTAMKNGIYYINLKIKGNTFSQSVLKQ